MYSSQREEYGKQLAQQALSEHKECVFCRIYNESSKDEINYVLNRNEHTYTMLSLYPYDSNSIQILIVTNTHCKRLQETLFDAEQEIYDVTRTLFLYLNYRGCKVISNTNQGALNASIPDHYHRHIIGLSNDCHNLLDAIKNEKQIDLPKLYKELKLELFTTKCSDTEYFLPHSNYYWQQDCYLCTLLSTILPGKDQLDDFKNLIIYRNQYLMSMIAHHPDAPAEIIVFPCSHYTLKTIPTAIYNKINRFASITQAIACDIVQTPDSNMGFNEFEQWKKYHGHFFLRIIPRKKSWIASSLLPPVIGIDILKYYKQIQESLSAIEKCKI